MAGATTQAERQAQVLAAGYNGPMTDAAVNQAYANAATPSDLAQSGISNTPQGSSGGGGGGGAPQTSSYPGVSGSDLQKIQAGFAASSGLSIKQLDEQIREFDANLDWQKQMWQQQGLPQLAIQQRAQTLAEKTQADQLALAQNQQAFTEEIGRRQAALAEKTQADANALGQGQLGLDTLKTAASLTGPQDWIKAANFSRGVAQSNLPAFMTDLLTGQSTATMGGTAPGSTMSGANSLGSLAASMGATVPGAAGTTVTAQGAPVSSTGQTGASQAADMLRTIYAQGGQALGPQAMEGLTPTEKAMFQGGGSDLGADVQGFQSAYDRSRIGQQSALPGWL